MHDEDDAPRRPAQFAPRPLDTLGVAELEAYIAALRVEIGRAETEIARKTAMRDDAARFFRGPVGER